MYLAGKGGLIVQRVLNPNERRWTIKLSKATLRHHSPSQRRPQKGMRMTRNYVRHAMLQRTQLPKGLLQHHENMCPPTFPEGNARSRSF